MIVQKAYKYRFYPTDQQIEQLAHSFGCARYVYNLALQYRTESWQQENKSVNYHETAKRLTEWKKEDERLFLNDVSSVVLQQSLRNLDSAFENFFDKRAKYPNFKSKHDAQSIRYATNAFTFKDGRLTLAKQAEPLNIAWSRDLPNDAQFVNATVSKDKSGRYFVSILVKTDVKPLKKVKQNLGIDVGLKDMATLSTGEKIENPRFLQTKERRLKIRQRRLSKKIKGSNNRTKAKAKIAGIHARIADTRRDYIHKFTTKTIRENQAIFVEGLNVVGMMKNHCLAKSIASVSWGMTFGQLKYKAEWYDRTYRELDRFFPSSQLCSTCSHRNQDLKLSDREWTCSKCSTVHDRDTNAAINILKAGEYLLKTTGSDARKVTPTRYERRRSA